jgi:hypothetical protein
VPPEAWKEAVRQALAIPLFHEEPKPRPAQAPGGAQEPPERKNLRKTLETPCMIGTPGKKLKGTLLDISLSGARVVVEPAFTVGSQVGFSFTIPGTFPPKFVHFKARIVRQTEDGYAIAFWEMDPLTRSYIGALIKR